jgi:hypothetical protein
MADEKINASELRELAKISGNLNDSIRESIASLSKMARSYDTVIAKIDNFNKKTINTKKIEKELETLRAKRDVAENKFTEAKAKFTGQSRLDAVKVGTERYAAQLKKVEDLVAKGDTRKLVSQRALLNLREDELNKAKKALEAEDINYMALKESSTIAQKQVDFAEDRLFEEKQLEKQLGKTGVALDFIGKKTGLFKNTYGEFVEKARDGNNTIASGWLIAGAAAYGLYKVLKFSVLNAIDLIKQGLSSLSSGANNPLAGISGAFSNILKQIPFIGGFFGGFLDILTSISGILLDVDDKLVKAGRSLNMNTQQARQLYDQYQKVAAVSGDTFITSQKLLQSRVELGTELGVNNSISEANLKTDTKLRDIAGIELETRARILENSIIAGQNSEDLVKNIFAQVKGLENATGISLNYQKVLKEANSLGGYLGLAFAKYPDKITKAVVTTKALGLSLKELDGMADSFLDFESSIASQFEAQLLTGKELNLQTARRLFLNNDLAGAAMEINKQVGGSEEYLNMNRIAAESLAKAFGMNRDQLGDMLKKQELLSRIGASQTSNAREQLKLGLEKYKTQENLVKAIGEEAYTNLVNASTQEKIAAFLDKVKTSFVDFLENSKIIEKLESFINYLSSPANMAKILNTIKGIVATGIEVMGYIGYAMVNIADFFTLEELDKVADNLLSKAQSAAGNVRSFSIATPETVSNSVIQATTQQGATASVGGGQTIINNYTNGITDATLIMDSSAVGRVTMSTGQSAPVGANTSNPYLRVRNNSITGQAT